MIQLIYYVLLSLLLPFPSQVLAQSFPQEQENQIREVLENFYSAWNQHDAKKAGEYLAGDADLRTSWNEWGKNRKEIEDILASEFEKQMKDAQIKNSINSIKMIKPNIAFVDVESTLTGKQTSDKKQYAPLHHHVVFVLENRDGKWQILIARPF